MYDAVIQAGHFGRSDGLTGTQGLLVTEQELVAYVAQATVAELRRRGLKATFIGADRNFAGLIQAKVFLALHADAASDACTTGPSIGYPGDERPEATGSRALAVPIILTVG